MLECSSQFVKVMVMIFLSHYQIQTCFETIRTVWVPKHLFPQKIFFFSISIQLKLR